MKRYIWAGTVVALTIAVPLSVIAASGCYIDDNVTCSPSKTKKISCDDPNSSSGGKKDKEVSFTITKDCTVSGSREVKKNESGFVNLQTSRDQSCNAEGWWPDCNGNNTGTVTESVTCNVSITDRTSNSCKATGS